MWIMGFLLCGVCLPPKNENGRARTRSTVDCVTEFLNEVSRKLLFTSFHEFMTDDCSAGHEKRSTWWIMNTITTTASVLLVEWLNTFEILTISGRL